MNKKPDLLAFQNGDESQAYQYMGAHLKGDFATFRVWAPNAESVSVVGDFNQWDPTQTPMSKEDGGLWFAALFGLSEYDNYKYAIKTQDGKVIFKADPYAFHAETRPQTASKLYTLPDYPWGDAAWIRHRKKHRVYESPLNIYELHPGSWRRGENGCLLSYRLLADQLIPYVKSLGFTHIELMPIMEHPYDGSWGYQCTGYFAPTSRYGTPYDFMYFVDECHKAGLGVILDWVPAHFPKDAHGLMEFDGGCLYEYQDPKKQEHPHWGTRIFDFGRGEVMSFLISAAMFFLREYHIDGLRVDAVASMLYLDYGKEDGQWTANRDGGNQNLEAVAFLQKLNEAAFAYDDSLLMIAEESTAWPQVTSPVYMGGLGFNLKWNMGWMNDILHYTKLDPYFRQFNHKDITFSFMYAFGENFLLPLSHDEVVHMKGSLIGKMPGDYDAQLAGVRLFYAYMLAHPGKKLLFMGAEIGQSAEWDFAGELDFSGLADEKRQKLHEFFKAAGAFYLQNSELWEIDFDWQGFSWICPEDHLGNTVAFCRKNKKGDELIFLCNFSPVDRTGYLLGVDEAGVYEIVFSSDRADFGGGDMKTPLMKTQSPGVHNKPHAIEVPLPPFGALFIRKKSGSESNEKKVRSHASSGRSGVKTVRSNKSSGKARSTLRREIQDH